MEKVIKGKAFVLGDNIDTDQIIPAEHLVYSLTDPNEIKFYGKYALSGVPLKDAGLPTGGKPFIDKFYEKYKNVLPKKPEASMLSMDRLGREVNVRMYFPEGRINEFYDLQPELMRDIVHCWDKFKVDKCDESCQS